jgi:hypothetical protein
LKVSRVLVVLLMLGLSVAATSPPHTLEAKGSRGWIKFWGDGTVQVSGRGTLTVRNVSNQQIELKGTWEEVKKLADGAVYTHFEGSLHTVGLGVQVELRGWDLALSAKGVRGKVWFRGDGTATLDGSSPEAWPDDPDKWLKVTY